MRIKVFLFRTIFAIHSDKNYDERANNLTIKAFIFTDIPEFKNICNTIPMRDLLSKAYIHKTNAFKHKQLTDNSLVLHHTGNHTKNVQNKQSFRNGYRVIFKNSR